MKLSQNSRPSDQLNLDKLADYLKIELQDFANVSNFHVEQFSGGASNLTYRLSIDDKDLILRRPPSGTKAKSAHDMQREYSTLKTIAGFYSLSPRPVLLCLDESVIGEQFFIMQPIDGLAIDKNLPVDMNENQIEQLCKNYVHGLVELHDIDINQSEIASLGKPQGYVKRQLEGWNERFSKAKTDDVLANHKIYQWLVDNLPLNSGQEALIHNDYKFDNLVLDKKNPEKIIGVLDWEMSTLGDPLLDLGCSLAYWIEADDAQELHAIRMMPTHLPGMMTRQQIFESYCKERGLVNIELKPYYIFGLFRLAAIAQQIYYRLYHGQTDNPKFKHFASLVNILIQAAEKQMATNAS
jgi:aminoglycoside phosphotransferase (APT) family kinase protein